MGDTRLSLWGSQGIITSWVEIRYTLRQTYDILLFGYAPGHTKPATYPGQFGWDIEEPFSDYPVPKASPDS
jgi:hypothetical protein